ncbi:hypothetical protein M427DRAFT_30291 [Gonapodya prolifera JEL478]|uniref:Uncharacterized protein n=1 Tax=Gonapodya prolifera (strain JEL478) TaxID=1344416 RepID=A0A139AM43_GONPJ|nr:hypothetical protein M427DRAFT_30291 [Gonapodya prolifera JEL478]|eukprot:KXS17846.1 hypothetical protein M427DRAFT_30291 [Gonapodya prolifera JEL478]
MPGPEPAPLDIHHLKILNHPLNKFNPRDPCTSLRKYHTFISGVNDYVVLYGLATTHSQAITLVSPNVPDSIQDSICLAHPDASTLTLTAWKKSHKTAYFPPDPHVWHCTLAKLEWYLNTSCLSIHVLEFIHIAHRTDIIDSSKQDLREHLSTQNLWYHFLDSLPQHVRFYVTLLGISNLGNFTRKKISLVESNLNNIASTPATPIAGVAHLTPPPAYSDPIPNTLARLESTIDQLAQHVATLAIEPRQPQPSYQHIPVAPPGPAPPIHANSLPPFTVSIGNVHPTIIGALIDQNQEN